MEPEMPREELQAVARRPAKGSLKNFFGDLRDLMQVRTLRATVQEFVRDDALGLAAQLAYYLILAIFPFILFLVAVLDAFGSSSPQFVNELFDYLRRVMPAQVFDLIEAYTERTLRDEDTAPGLLSAGILGTIWAASGAFSSLINALNRAYDVQETRPFWKVKGLAILMTLGLSILVLGGALLLIAGPSIGETIAEVFTLDDEFVVVWSVARWPAALLFMVATVALLFYFAPDAGQPFRWITPGGFVGIVLWVLASVAFNLYLGSDFNTYDKTYGSIGTVIVLLLYLYISSLTILFGATLNATLVRMKEEISGERILDAEPAHEKPDLLDEEAIESVQDAGK
ncbi:MAG: Inner membrane protein YihY, formerly thought to be RNase BN [uncultured Rubrobacteraceae bacterium]|uniref:Inner membrane protein YihY, formerly thought to be RNase BN n=1 Tax=uncultured Rubrobacteraceae bacterium TaxID=349277 RepID=A0A6J4NYG8_9ACTN|nr:MAG: Inner membrane protein YihY, formerly thought to be RNase BN [uncultured Rubrobacteraceae bacterium]